MLGPVSQVFYLDFLYGSSKGNVQKGQKVFDSIGLGPNNPYYSSPLVEGETEATGTGSTASFSFNLSYTPVRAGSFTLTDGVQVITDDGNGNLVGDGTGTIDYTSGAVASVFATNPVANAVISSNYELTEKSSSFIQQCMSNNYVN